MKVTVGECPLSSSVPLGLRLSLILIVTLMVFSTASLTISNPVSAVPTDATPSVPSTIGQDGNDFTTQALSSLTARPTNNIVNTNSFYDVVFVTGTSGAIKRIQVTFPAGTTVPTGASFNEAEGIGPGTVSKSGQTLTYTVTNAVNVPAGTKIRLEFANINNPLSPSANYKVTVTTRNAANTPIDGPTQSAAYTVKQIGPNVIANNAVTNAKIADFAVTTSKLGTLSVSGSKLQTGSVSTSKIESGAITTPKIADNSITSIKPAESFMKRVGVVDDLPGHGVGWNPNDFTTAFEITEPLASGFGASAIVNVVSPSSVDILCAAGRVFNGIIGVICATAPPEGSILDYTVINLPLSG